VQFVRIALGVSYKGQHFQGWQSQLSGNTVQDQLEAALSRFANTKIRTLCAGRTDSGVHALNQVVHFDCDVVRAESSWVRGTNRYLPPEIAIQWCQFVPDTFHARNSALGRRYAYVLLESAVRPAIEAGCVGWCFRPLNGAAMQTAAQHVLGEHDFTAFRAAECQAASPVKTLRAIRISQHHAYWRFEFDANAFLHHMVRNLMGSLLAVGTGARTPDWLADVLSAKDRHRAAATYPADGLYFVGPYYRAEHAIAEHTNAMNWLPS
jgi:tRNA pseudouridine38-40 synthase